MEIGDRNKHLSIEEDLNKIKSYLKDIIIIYKNVILEKFN